MGDGHWGNIWPVNDDQLAAVWKAVDDAVGFPAAEVVGWEGPAVFGQGLVG